MMSSYITGCQSDFPSKNLEHSVSSSTLDVKKLNVLLWYQDEGRKLSFNNYISKYKEVFPNIEVEFEFMVDMIELQSKTQAYCASGALPDIIFSFSPTILPLIEANQLLDLSGYIEKDGFIQKYTNPSCIQTFSDEALYALNSGGIDFYFAPAIFYHKNLFSLYEQEVPHTFEEWLNVCKAFKANNITPIALSGKDGTFPAMEFIQLFYMASDPIAVKEILQGKTDWSNPAFITSIDKVGLMARLGYFSEDVTTKNYNDALDDFIGNKAAMIFAGGWEISNFASRCTDVAIMEMPSINANVIPGQVIEMWGAKYGGYAVSATSEYKSLSVAFAEFCAESDAKTYGKDMCLPVAFKLDENYALSDLAIAQKHRVDSAIYRLPNLTEWVMDAKTQSEYYALMNRLMTGTLSGDQFSQEFSAIWEDNNMVK